MAGVSRPVVGVLVGLAAVAGYFGAAVYLDKSYDDPKPRGRKVRMLLPPFERIGFWSLRYGVPIEPGTVIYEDKDPLDPLDETEAYRGAGRFQVLPNGITFSSTDGTDPNDARHRYWLVIK